MNKKTIKILHQQLKLLAEQSKEASVTDLKDLSIAMTRIGALLIGIDKLNKLTDFME